MFRNLSTSHPRTRLYLTILRRVLFPSVSETEPIDVETAGELDGETRRLVQHKIKSLLMHQLEQIFVE